jgi:hypothetical protein
MRVKLHSDFRRQIVITQVTLLFAVEAGSVVPACDWVTISAWVRVLM